MRMPASVLATQWNRPPAGRGPPGKKPANSMAWSYCSSGDARNVNLNRYRHHSSRRDGQVTTGPSQTARPGSAGLGQFASGVPALVPIDEPGRRRDTGFELTSGVSRFRCAVAVQMDFRHAQAVPRRCRRSRLPARRPVAGWCPLSMAAKTDDGLRLVDVWEIREAFELFGPRNALGSVPKNRRGRDARNRDLRRVRPPRRWPSELLTPCEPARSERILADHGAPTPRMNANAVAPHRLADLKPLPRLGLLCSREPHLSPPPGRRQLRL